MFCFASFDKRYSIEYHDLRTRKSLILIDVYSLTEQPDFCQMFLMEYNKFWGGTSPNKLKNKFASIKKSLC